ncbi:hypothetical protein [Streptomyces shenzhenensis]|uniref:hypothetical protein n=1 Tax=Streptomyces shenzhenensis TaxID=943815 RepID=UPI001F25E4B4|nr:hypothetical protein [Streptomyces shenzhenensis]
MAAEEVTGDGSFGSEDPVDVLCVRAEFVVGPAPGPVVDRAELEAQSAPTVRQMYIDHVTRAGSETTGLHPAAHLPFGEQAFHAAFDEEVVGTGLTVVLAVTDRSGRVVGEVTHLRRIAAITQLASAAAQLQTASVGVVLVGLAPSVRFPRVHRQDHRVVEHETSQEDVRGKSHSRAGAKQEPSVSSHVLSSQEE